MTYTNRSPPYKTALNAFNADATANPNTAAPTDTSVNASGHPPPPTKKTADPGSKRPPSNQPIWVPCSKHLKKCKHTDMEYRIDWGVTNGTLWVCKSKVGR